MARERGFTVVELVAAVTIGGMVVLLAHTLFAGVIEGTDVAQREWERFHASSNAQRLLGRLIGSIEVGRSPTEAFRGEQHEVAFSTWYTDAGGRVVRRNVYVGLTERSVRLKGLDCGTVDLIEDATSLQVDYLSGFGAEASWLIGWSSTASAPVAIRMRVGRASRTDTLLFLVGARG